MKLSTWLHQREKVRLAALLLGPTLWLVVAYLGALVALLLTSFFTINSFTGNVIRTFNLGNYVDLFTDSAYANSVVRTVSIALLVTLFCLFLGFPIAFYIAKIASPKRRQIYIALILTPLWASYLVKIYAWRSMLEPGSGVIEWLISPIGLHSPGFGFFAVVIGLSYLWLPYMILPIYAGLDRLPNSLLDASSDLGARNSHTLRRVVLPILTPSIVAGAMFTFSLSLGDYITVQILGGKLQMLGNVVYQNFSLNLPFAAAVSAIPIVIMAIFLWGIRRTGALSNL